MVLNKKTFQVSFLFSFIFLSLLLLTSSKVSAQTTGDSQAYGIWNPDPTWDTRFFQTGKSTLPTCTKAEHDSFFVIGPDGKRYPTWHPATFQRPDGTTCTFGHEHGVDPSTSSIWSDVQKQYAYDANNDGTIDATELATAGLPFGYVNEQLEGTGTTRHEDHVGHKVFTSDNVPVDFTPTGGSVGGAQRQSSAITCSYIEKVHQGTYSSDAFQNSAHEILYAVKCNDGRPGHSSDGQAVTLSVMGKFGRQNEFQITNNCGSRSFSYISLGTRSGSRNDGSRMMTDRQCVLDTLLVPNGQFSGFPYEAWPVNLGVKTASGQQLVSGIALLFDVLDPVRYYYPGKTNSSGVVTNVGYFVDTFYETESNGDRWHGGAFDESTNYGNITDLTFDDPRSTFRDLHRGAYFKPADTLNANGPAVWYTDVYGANAQTTPFTGSVKQYIKQWNFSHATELQGVVEPTVLELTYPDGNRTVHAPN